MLPVMADAPNLLRFTPVPLQRRARGWTPDAQAAFIAALAQCGIVAHAARSVGCSPRSAYHLRARPGADSFAAAWDWAIEMGLDAARDRAMALIHDDAPRPLYRGRREVGYRTGPDHRIMFAALRSLAGDVEGHQGFRVGCRALLKRATDDAAATKVQSVYRGRTTTSPSQGPHRHKRY